MHLQGLPPDADTDTQNAQRRRLPEDTRWDACDSPVDLHHTEASCLGVDQAVYVRTVAKSLIVRRTATDNSANPPTRPPNRARVHDPGFRDRGAPLLKDPIGLGLYDLNEIH